MSFGGYGSTEMQLTVCTGFDGCVNFWDVRIGASTTPHLMHHWDGHPGSEILTILHDPMKNVIITAGNDDLIKVGCVSTCTHAPIHPLTDSSICSFFR